MGPTSATGEPATMGGFVCINLLKLPSLGMSFGEGGRSWEWRSVLLIIGRSARRSAIPFVFRLVRIRHVPTTSWELSAKVILGSHLEKHYGASLAPREVGVVQ